MILGDIMLHLKHTHYGPNNVSKTKRSESVVEQDERKHERRGMGGGGGNI